jgi:uncharacterized protein YecT (DUF1311 family)
MNLHWLAILSAASLPALAASAQAGDRDAAALTRCLGDAANASTAGQTDCEAAAARAYDRRMNAAYAALRHALPPAAAQQLRQSQRAWLAFRNAEAQARDAFYATRRGTMYVPMQASAATDIVRDRALQLETLLRVLRIDA